MSEGSVGEGSVIGGRVHTVREGFARHFPNDAELDKLVSAFDAGDYLTVRTEAPKVAARATDPAVKNAALDLRRRIEPDPVQLYLLVLTLLLLGFLVTWFYLHKHA